jgi:hypothetical protein
MTVVFARYRQGIVSEANRVSHALTVPDDGDIPETLKSFCGQSFPPGVLELMSQWAGMPCIGCTVNMPFEVACELLAGGRTDEHP